MTIVTEDLERRQAGEPERPSAPAAPSRRRWWRRPALVGASVLVGLLGVGVAALAYDRATRDRFLPGVTIGGVKAGGLSADAVVRRVQRELPSVEHLTVPVTAASSTARPSLGDLGVRSDVAAVARRARQHERSMGLVSRLWHRLARTPVHDRYAVHFRTDPEKAASLVQRLAKEVEREPRDASIDTSTGFVQVVPGVEGRELDVPAAAQKLVAFADRVANEGRAGEELVLPVRTKAPGVATFPHVLLVRLGENKLYHYVNGSVAKVYTVATGMPAYPTPTGTFHVVAKHKNPVWINPDPKGWGKDMPARIPPGPNNPLGTRAMALEAPGINIHGTANLRSLGYSVSHGCIRMSIAESEELFDAIPQGTPVVVLSAGPPRTLPAPPPSAPPPPIDNPNVPVNLEAGQ